MLYDRSYMRTPSGEKTIPWLYWILGVTFGAFVIQMLFSVWGGQGALVYNWFALGVSQILSGKVWTCFTYSLLHQSIFHLLGNLVVLFFIGYALEATLSQKHIAQAYLFSVVFGGFAFLLTHWGGGQLIGASAGALGLLILFCSLEPNRPITLMLFFVLPIRIRPKWITYFLLAFNGLGFLFVDLPGAWNKTSLAPSDSIGYSAHLGGMLAGYLYYRFALGVAPLAKRKKRKPKMEPPNWVKRKSSAEPRRFQVNMSSRADLRHELDRILDKISAEGFGSLSKEEKKTLDKAKDSLKRS